MVLRVSLGDSQRKVRCRHLGYRGSKIYPISMEGTSFPRLLAARTGAIARLSAALLVALSLDSVPALAASGDLSLSAAAVETVGGGELVVVQVTNASELRVEGLRVSTDTPAGVAVRPAAFTRARLSAGASALFRFKVIGGPAHQPASLVITATGRQGAIPVSAIGAVTLAANEADVQVTLSGDDTITDTSPATDVAILQNLVDAPVSVILTASAGPQVVRMAHVDGQRSETADARSLRLRLPPHSAVSVVIRTTAHLPLPRGSVPLVVTATTTGADGLASQIIATKDLKVSLAADVLPGPLGIGSVVLVPGLVAMWAIVARYQRDRKRIGLQTPSAAAQVWDNKILLAAAILVSVVASFAYRFLGFGDVWSAPRLSDIVILSAASAVIGALVTDVILFFRRFATPAVSPDSEPLDVLRAAARTENSIARPVYKTTDGLRGLLVQMDWGAVIITPPIQYAEVDDIPGSSLSKATDLITGTQNPREHIQFLSDQRYVQGPCAGGAIRLADQKEEILQYTDDPLRGASAGS